MGKKITKKSSPPSKESSEFLDQKFTNEKCLFNDAKIGDLIKEGAFPDSAVFRAFDPSSKPDMISDEWICFPALPFKLGFKYPFPALTTDFFDISGLSYIQAMPMVWRVLWTLENLVGEGGHQFELSDLAYGYEVKSHGSNFYLLKTKQGMNPLILRTTRNDPHWKNNFFFVKRSSIPNGKSLPKEWITEAIHLSNLAPPREGTAQRFAEILKLEDKCRTFGNNVFGEGSSESHPTGSAMSSESRRIAKEISFDDVTSLISAAGTKRERASPRFSKPPLGDSPKPSSIAASLSDIPASKRKKIVMLDNTPFMSYSDARKRVDSLLQHMDTCLAAAEKHNQKLKRVVQNNEQLAQQRAAVSAEQEKKIKGLEDEVARLKDATERHEQEMQDLASQHTKALGECLEGARNSTAIFVLQDRLQVVKEAEKKGADISLFEVEAWEKALANLKGGDEPEVEEADAAGSKEASEGDGVNAGDDTAE